MSVPLLNLPISISFEIVDDATPEGREEFVLEVISAELRKSSTEQALEVSVVNSKPVTIHDNDGRLCILVLLKQARIFLSNA